MFPLQCMSSLVIIYRARYAMCICCNTTRLSWLTTNINYVFTRQPARAAKLGIEHQYVRHKTCNSCSHTPITHIIQ